MPHKLCRSCGERKHIRGSILCAPCKARLDAWNAQVVTDGQPAQTEEEWLAEPTENQLDQWDQQSPHVNFASHLLGKE